MEDSKFDVVILRTGLTESIVAAALSKWGYKVAHIDQNPYYGGEQASLTLEEFAKWVDRVSSTSGKFSQGSRSGTIPPYAHHYSVCLCPTVNPSVGPFIDALVHSGVSKYSGFRLLECVAVYDGTGAFRSVPGNKEDVFKSKDISLLQKRRLMRFLTFAVGDWEQSSEIQGKHDLPFPDFLESAFSLNPELITVITYALAYSSRPADSTISVLPRMQRYLRSVGRYGSSPFLVGHYGGVGELSQGFCRTAAVNGAVYILGRRIISISPGSSSTQPSGIQLDPAPRPFRYSLNLEDMPESLYARVIIGPASYTSDQVSDRSFISPSFQSLYTLTSVARCVAIIEHSIALRPSLVVDDTDDDDGDKSIGGEEASLDKALDTAILVFPPDSLDSGSSQYSAVVLITGESALSTPKGKYILYISLPVPSQSNPSQVLQPYLDTILRLGREEPQAPLFTAFYVENLDETSSLGTDASQETSWIIPPSTPLCPLGDIADAATQNAEILFHAVLRALGDRYQKNNSHDGGIWPEVLTPEDEDEV